MKYLTQNNLETFFESINGDDIIISSLPLSKFHKIAFEYGFFIEQLYRNEFRCRQIFDEKRLKLCTKLKKIIVPKKEINSNTLPKIDDKYDFDESNE